MQSALGSTSTTNGKMAKQQAEEIDVAGLAGHEEKIKMLMRRDPRFIGRLIEQLDRQMHARLAEKLRRQQERRADQAAIDRIDETIRNNVQPCLVGLGCSAVLQVPVRRSCVCLCPCAAHATTNTHAPLPCLPLYLRA